VERVGYRALASTFRAGTCFGSQFQEAINSSLGMVRISGVTTIHKFDKVAFSAGMALMSFRQMNCRPACSSSAERGFSAACVHERATATVAVRNRVICEQVDMRDSYFAGAPRAMASPQGIMMSAVHNAPAVKLPQGELICCRTNPSIAPTPRPRTKPAEWATT